MIVAVLPLAVGCIQSTHGDGPNGPPVPGGEVRVLEDTPGDGRAVLPGDRVRVDFVGRYASGDTWGRGPLTLIVGAGTYPYTTNALSVGSVVRMQYVVHPSDTGPRLMPFPGGDSENEAYQVRRDRGQIIVEHRVREACRPLKVLFLNTGFGNIESSLGCWRTPLRASAPVVTAGMSALERREAELNHEPLPSVAKAATLDPPIVARPRIDTSQYLGEDGIHLAAREGRPDIVGWLIAQGKSASALDRHGFAPIHYVGFAQTSHAYFVPALEQNYVDVVDTLLAHGALVDARAESGQPPHAVRENEQGQTALVFAGAECADKLSARLLERGADPNLYGKESDPPIVGAARNGCPEIVQLLLAHGANVELQPHGGGTPLERLVSVSAFHEGHTAAARLLVRAGAKTAGARKRLEDRLNDPGQGGFGFSNRPEARRILELLRNAPR